MNNIFIRQRAKDLYFELKYNKLEVVLIDAPEIMHYEHKIRVAVSHNPKWYSDYYNTRAAHPTRKTVLKALICIAAGFKFNSVYYSEILELIHNTLLHGYTGIDTKYPINIDYINFYFNN